MRKDTKFNVLLTSDDTLKAMFECKHDRVVCVKCICLGKCEHDCPECFEDEHGKQLTLPEGD